MKTDRNNDPISNGASENELGDDTADDTACWQVEEIDQPITKKKGGVMVNTQETIVMWHLNPLAKLPPTPVSDRYCIFYNDTQWEEGDTVDESKIFMVRWDRMLSLRCLKQPFIDMVSTKPKQLHALRYPSQETVALVTTMTPRADWQSKWPDKKRKDENLYRTDYWDKEFSRGQLIATKWRPPQLAKGWSRLQSQPWQKMITGFYKGDISTGSDSRTFENKDDGIAYSILSDGVDPPPSDAVYIKLSPRSRGSGDNKIPGHATQVVDGGQPACAKAGVTNKGIYVAKTTIDLLRTGKYKWGDNFSKLYIRIHDGGIFCLSVPSDSRNLQEASFWQDAYDYGIQSFEGNISRARNPDSLQLLFVVSQRSRIKVEELATLVTEVQKKHPTTKQRAKVVSEAAASADKDVFNYKLSISPFGDFQTWIKESDYVAYLTAYPVHPFPEDLKTITDVNLKIAPAARAFQQALQNKLEKQAKESEEKHPNEPSARSSTVSNDTVTAAARQRDSVAKEGKQMGASATVFARAFGWNDVDKFVGNVTEGGIRWGDTGNWPAEWLHRCAYSWGSTLGKDVNQSSKNLVFGSSESNGLLIRYEKAWQDLFRSEAKVRRAREAAGVAVPADDFKGIITTINTSAGRAILSETIGSDKTSIRSTWYRKGLTKDDKGKPKIRVFAFSPIYGKGRNPTSKDLSEDDPEYKDYWDWTKKQPFMCFHLLYKCDFSAPSSMTENFGLQEVSFYPFQRGFYTKLEFEVDRSLMKKWTDDATARIPTNVPNINALRLVDLNADAEGNRNTELLHVRVWKKVLAEEHIHLGQLPLQGATIATLGSDTTMLSFPSKTLPRHGLASSPSSGNMTFLVRNLTLPVALPKETTSLEIPAPTSINLVPSGVHINGLPVVAVPKERLTDVDVPSAFTVKSDIKLFGIFDTTRYSFYGTKEEGVRESIPLGQGKISISDILPSFKDTIIDDWVLESTKFKYNEYDSKLELAGTWFETLLTFGHKLEVINDVLKNVFQQESPAVYIQAFLSPRHDWSKPFLPPALCLRGSLPGGNIQVTDKILLANTSISISIGYSSQATPDRPWGEDTVLWALGFSASAIFTISEMNKISMDFSLSYFDSLLQLELHSSKSSVLADFAGIHGLTLSSFYLSSAISTSESPSILSFSAKATLELRDTTLQLDGLYSNKEDWTVACELDDLDIDGLCNLYEDVFGQELHLPGQDVEITKIDFIITNKGISLSAAVRIGDHTSAEGSLTFDALGVHINGKIDGNLISINNDIHLVDPKFEVFIGRQTDTDVAKPGTSWRFAISGTVTTTVGDIPALKQGIEASLYLGKDTTGKYQWMVYGSFAAGFRVSDIVSALKDNEVLDLAVDNAKFIASSISNPPLAVDAVPVAFTIMEGVQVAATLSPIDEFDKTMKNTTPSTMVLQAGYNTETSAFRIGFDLVTQQQFSAKSGSVYSDPVHPLSIYVDIGGIPTLTVDARFLVKVSKQPDLPFRGGIKISPKGAEMYVQLEPEHTWKNPFDISEQLVLGPQVALDLGIDFEAPIWPSRLQAVAELAVGTVSGKAAMGISESPDEELLILKVERLKISDLITFASMIFDQKIPAVDDFLEFKTFDLYLSGGTNIGTIVYPLGARFACDAVVFGKEATLEVSVLKQQKAITVRGSLDPVQFGPLTITGAIPDTKPEIEIALGATKQRFYINGACSILGLSGSLYLDARILGDDGKDPGIDLNVKIAFTDHMTFRLQASTPSEVKRLSLSSVDQLQFDVDCYFHQDILEYIIEHVHKQIESAKASAQKGIDSAVHDLDVAEAKYQKDLDDAMTTMEEKRKLFDIEMAKAEQRFDEGVKRLKDTEEQLLGDWKIANEKFRLLCEGAKQFLQAVKQQQVEAIGKAKQDVSDAKREATNKIDAHLKELQQARNNMKRDFADAVGKLESARQDVKAARYEADDALTKLIKAQKDLEDCHWYEALYYAEEVTRHSIVCAACEAAYQIADGVLLNCEYVLENPLYKAAEASIDLYEKKLREAERDAEKTLDGLNSTLATVEADEQKKVDEASEKLDAARTRNRELFESENARKALDAAREAAERELSDLKATFDAVSKCVEAVAFDVASAAVQTARGLTAGIDIARSTLHDAEIATGAILDLGDYLVNRALGVLDIRNVHITGHLEGLCNRSSKLTAHLDGTVASEDFSTDLEFTPGQGDELIKAVFRAILDRVDNMSIDFPQRPGVLTPLPDSPPDVSPYHPDEWVFVPRTPQQETRRLLQMIKDDVGTERRWLSEYLERHETDVSAREMWARVNAVVPKIHLAMQNGTTWPENVIQAVNHSRFRQPWLGREKEWALFYIDGIESLL